MLGFIIIYFIFINLFYCSLMYIDKYKAKQQRRRNSEKTIWFSAFVGGAWGASIGMKAFRHKTKHRVFKFGLPVLANFQIAVFIYYILKEMGM